MPTRRKKPVGRPSNLRPKASPMAITLSKDPSENNITFDAQNNTVTLNNSGNLSMPNTRSGRAGQKVTIQNSNKRKKLKRDVSDDEGLDSEFDDANYDDAYLGSEPDDDFYAKDSEKEGTSIFLVNNRG
jgi:hypothetical protein